MLEKRPSNSHKNNHNLYLISFSWLLIHLQGEHSIETSEKNNFSDVPKKTSPGKHLPLSVNNTARF